MDMMMMMIAWNTNLDLIHYSIEHTYDNRKSFFGLKDFVITFQTVQIAFYKQKSDYQKTVILIEGSNMIFQFSIK